MIGRAVMGPAQQVPNPGPITPPGLGDLANQLLGWMKWGVIVAGVAGVLTCALMLIVGRRNRSATAQEGLVGAAWVLGGLALASVAALLVGVFKL